MNKAQIDAWRRSLRRQPEPRRVVSRPAPAAAVPDPVPKVAIGTVSAEVTGPGEITMQLAEGDLTMSIVAQRGWVGRDQRVWILNDGNMTLGQAIALLWPERDRRNTGWLQAQLDQQYANHERRKR